MLDRSQGGRSHAEGNTWGYDDWMFRRVYVLVPAQGFVGKFVKSFKEYPPRGLPASFSVGDALKMMSKSQHH
jgi:arylsulfatase